MADGSRFCPASEEAACTERTFRRYGGDKLVARAAAPAGLDTEQLDALVAFMVAHPRATLADVMAEFDLSDTEAAAALRTLRAGLIKLRHAVLAAPVAPVVLDDDDCEPLIDDELAAELHAECWPEGEPDESDDLAAHLRETVDELRKGE